MIETRGSLERRWLKLTREVLPGLAEARAWPVRADHCFQRILLDAACGRCWYDVVSGRPAYRHIDAGLLIEAVRIAEAAAAGTADLHGLNHRSLRFRGKA